MAFEERFNPDEQQLLTTIPQMIGTCVAFSEASGVFGTLKEIWASSKNSLAGIKEYPANEIITGVLPNLDDRAEAMEKAKEIRSQAKARMEQEGIKSKEDFHRVLIEDCKKACSILEEKANPEEAAEYKEWAIALAENVAKASSEGGFLGFGGTQVSEGEKAAIAEIADALGTSSPL